jgi:hypothetical protein
MCYEAVYKWVKRFSEGRESVTDERISGWPGTSRTKENIAIILRENLRVTVRSIAEQVNIDRKTVRKFLKEDLEIRNVCAKMVPRELTHRHCLEHPAYSPDLAHNDFFLFPKIKEIFKGRRFDDRSNTKAAL